MKGLLVCVLLSSQVCFGQGLNHILEIAPHPSLDEILGISILGVGDVNGDGWPDLAAGALRPKKTYFYWGGPGILDTIPDLVLPYIGREMRLADLNGDGRKDLILFNYSVFYKDSIRVFFGTSSPPYAFDTTSGLTFRLPDTTDIEWQSIAVGNLNGDAYDDLMLGIVRYAGVGKVCIYLGKSVPTDVPDFSVLGDTIGSGFGNSVVSGDIDGDGYSDILVSSLGDPSLGVDQLVDLWHGGPAFRFERNNYHQRFNATSLHRPGMSAARLVDFNLDGKVDLSYPDSGGAHFHWGGDTLSESPDYVVPPYVTVSTKVFQSGAVDIGDVNGDGLHDFAFLQFDGSYCVTAYMGNIPTPPLKPVGTRCRASTIGTTFYQIVPVGDMNGDGVDDFASSAPYDNYAGILPQPGYVVIFGGNRNWVTDVRKADAPCPCEIELSQNYPNPFNPSTTFEYTVPQPGRVTIRIVDLLGREVTLLVDEYCDAGTHSIRWNGQTGTGNPATSGVYLVQLETSGVPGTMKNVAIKKILLMR